MGCKWLLACCVGIQNAWPSPKEVSDCFGRLEAGKIDYESLPFTGFISSRPRVNQSSGLRQRGGEDRTCRCGRNYQKEKAEGYVSRYTLADKILEVFYNRSRRHCTLEYLSPDEIECMWFDEHEKPEAT